METMVVIAKLRGDPEISFPCIPVRIDGEINGTTDRLILLDPGTYEISVDRPDSDVVVVDVEDTTPQEPLYITVECAREVEEEETKTHKITRTTTKTPRTEVKYTDLQSKEYKNWHRTYGRSSMASMSNSSNQ